MAITINFAGASLKKPGAYSRIIVAPGGAAQAQLGVVAILGESSSGPAYAAESGLSAVTWTPEQYSAIAAKYGTGQLVDAARLSFGPSNDPQILGGAQQLLTMKTNQSTAASLTFGSPTYGTVTAQSQGVGGNNISLEIDVVGGQDIITISNSATGVSEISSAIGGDGALAIQVAGGGVSAATITINATTITTVITGGTVAGLTIQKSQYATIGQLVTFLNTQTGYTASALNNHQNDPLSVLDHVTALSIFPVANVEATDSITVALVGTNLDTITFSAAGALATPVVLTAVTGAPANQNQFQIGGSTGATATNLNAVINAHTVLSTAVASTVLGSVLSLAAKIATYPGVSGNSISLTTSDASAFTIATATFTGGVDAYVPKVNKDHQDIADFFALSGLVNFTQTRFVGIPSTLSMTFLTGGALGGTTQANFQLALDALSGTRVNFIVPLFSQDASLDIAAGLTDATSTYLIDSVHAAVQTHCAQNSTVKGRKERQGFVGFHGAYSAAKTKAASLGSARMALQFQDIDISDSQGTLYLAQPHMLALISAAMKAAAVVGLPNTFKLVNVNGFSVPNKDFDPETQADDAISANLTFIEKAPGGGFRFVLDNSTYGQTANAWIYSRPSVLYAADTLSFAIRLNMETFVGQRNSDVTPETVKNLLVSVLDGARSSGIIVPDAVTSGKGFKDLVVSFAGSVVKTSVTVTLVEGIEFILSDISVQRAAS